MAEIKGTNVASKIVPYTTSDNYATHDEEYGRGGYRTVNSVSEMNAIPAARRKEGMLVNVKGDKIYKLNSSNTFVDAGLGGGDVEIYMINTDNLNFELISDGKEINNNEIAELLSILERWNRGNTIPVYVSSSTEQMSYIGILNISVTQQGQYVVFSIPSDNNITLYSANINSMIWKVSVLNSSEGSSPSWDSDSNLSQNGYQKFSNGLMIQWGTRGGATGTTSLYFPTSFYNTNYNVYLTGGINNTGETYVYAPGYDTYGKSTSYFKFLTRGVNPTPAITWTSWNFTWFAIGRWK